MMKTSRIAGKSRTGTQIGLVRKPRKSMSREIDRLPNILWHVAVRCRAAVVDAAGVRLIVPLQAQGSLGTGR